VTNRQYQVFRAQEYASAASSHAIAVAAPAEKRAAAAHARRFGRADIARQRTPVRRRRPSEEVWIAVNRFGQVRGPQERISVDQAHVTIEAAFVAWHRGQGPQPRPWRARRFRRAGTGPLYGRHRASGVRHFEPPATASPSRPQPRALGQCQGLPKGRRLSQAARTGPNRASNNAPRREFLHVDDYADALVFLLRHYSDASSIDVGVSRDVTIAELPSLVAGVVGPKGGQIGSKPRAPTHEMDEVGKGNIADLAAHVTPRCSFEFMPVEGRVYFMRKADAGP
jgi:hypothetical protein